MRELLNSIGVNIPSFDVKRALYRDFRYPILHISIIEPLAKKIIVVDCNAILF